MSLGEKEKNIEVGGESIDDLLDSALQDFDKVPKKSKSKKTKPKEEDPEKELLELLEKVGLNSGSNGADLNTELLNLSKMAGAAGPSSSSSTSLQDALLQLAADTEKLQDLPSEDEFQKMFSGLQGGSLEQGLGNLLPMMEGMMQSLLSKELLYPAMKDMNDKFPDWLADNRPNLSEADYTKYNKQCDLTRRICHEFENEGDQCSETEKKARFEKIMALMQVSDH